VWAAWVGREGPAASADQEDLAAWVGQGDLGVRAVLANRADLAASVA